MPKSNYPLKEGYHNSWMRSKSNNKMFVRDYVRNALDLFDWTDRNSCELQQGKIQRVEILNPSGQNYFSEESWTNVCTSLEVDAFPTHITLNTLGIIEIYKQESLGIYGILRNYVYAALRGFNVFAAIAVVFNIKPMLQDMRQLGSKLKKSDTFIGNILTSSIEGYQKGFSWLDEKFYISYIYKFHKLTRVISPEYEEYWQAKEQRLAAFSNKVFGNINTLTQIVNFASLTYRIMIENTNKDEDAKRYAQLQHEQKIITRIQSKMRQYEINPNKVYSDLLYYSIDEGNKYRDANVVYRGYELFQDISNVSKQTTEIHDKLQTFGLYEAELSKLTLGEIESGFTVINDKVDTIYNEQIKPTIVVINRILEKQKAAIEEIQRHIEETNKAAERAKLITAKPEELTPIERIEQNNQFIKVFNNAIQEGKGKYNFNGFDIKDYYNE